MYLEMIATFPFSHLVFRVTVSKNLASGDDASARIWAAEGGLREQESLHFDTRLSETVQQRQRCVRYSRTSNCRMKGNFLNF